MKQSNSVTSAAGKGVDAPFPVHFERAGRGLRAALTELLASVAADPAKPQDVARDTGISKNLAWRICKIVQSPDVTVSMQHLPKAAGMETLLKVFTSAGASETARLGVQEALSEFDRMATLHAGDRATLGHMTEDLLADHEQSQRQEQSRKQAFQANSAIFGVRARVRLGVHVIAPDVDQADQLSYANVVGLLDFERLRASASWPLAIYRVDFHGDEDAPENGGATMDPPGGPGMPRLLREFSSATLPEIRTVHKGKSLIFECADGALGKTGANSFVFGLNRCAFAPIHGNQPGDRGEYFTSIRTPAEHLVFDLLVHRDLPYELPPSLAFYNLVHARIETPLMDQTSYLLPCSEKLEELGSAPPILSTSLDPQHIDIARWAVGSIGRDLGEFHGYRLTMAYPPMPTLAIQHLPLPMPPD